MAPRLAFIVYLSRSGSTFFADRIHRHPDVLVTPECRSLPILVNYFSKTAIANLDISEIVDRLYEDSKFRAWGLPKQKVLEAMEREVIERWDQMFLILCRCYWKNVKPSANVILVKKGGWHYKNVDTLLGTFRGAPVVWMFRDPRAVYNSSKKALHSETGRPLSSGPIDEALRWRQYYGLYRNAKEMWGEQILEVYYENIIDNLEGSLEAVWHALGVAELSDSDKMQIAAERRETHLVNDATRHLHDNVSRGPIKERVHGWRTELSPWVSTLILLLCGKGMRNLGYIGTPSTVDHK